MPININLGPIAGNISSLEDCLFTYTNNLNIGHINAQSLNPSNSNAKLEEFKSVFKNSPLHIIGISETWFKTSTLSQSLSLPGYNIVRNDRPDCQRAGGVCLYLSDKLHYKEVFRSEHYGICESLFVEVFGETPALIGVVYLPNGNINEFERLHSDLFDRFSNIIVMGDFNCNLFNNSASSNFRSSLSRCALSYVHNSIPTHLCVRSNSTSLIDYFLVSRTLTIDYHSQIQFPFFSSHHSFIIISIRFSARLRENWIEFKNYNKINYNQITQCTQVFDISPIFTTNDVSLQLSTLDSLINTLHDTVPVIRVKAGTTDNEWINSREIVTARNARDSAYGFYLRERSMENWRNYCKLRNKAKSVIRRVRREYGQRMFEGAEGSRIWCRLRKLGCIGRNRPQYDESEVENIAAIFLSNQSFDNDSNFNINDLVSNQNSFSFSSITEYELSLAINKIKSNAIGCDKIPIKFIKIIFPLISTILLHIINTIFTTSKYPIQWKLGRVIPIPKNGNYNADNLRPITILPAMSKIVENLMYEQILLHTRRLLHPNQYAFRQNYNTTSLLISMTDSIRRKLDAHSNCVMVSLDLTKAFDRVNHKILIRKLYENFSFSAPACRLMFSYLSERSQFVSFGNVNSTVGHVTSGLPQGSVLGPLLFQLYLNDFTSDLSNSLCELYVFADDIYLLYDVNSVRNSICNNRLNDHMDSIYNWMRENLLDINSAKTKAIYFGIPNSPALYPQIRINRINIQHVDVIKCLGLVIDNNLRFNCHVDSVFNGISFILRRLYALKSYTPFHIRHRLAHSLLMSKVNYCLEVYSGTLSSNFDRLERIVRRIVRYVFNLRLNDHERVTEAVSKFLGVNFNDYVKLRLLLQFYKVMKNGQPPSLVNNFSFLNSTRNSQIDIPRIHMSIFERSFIIRINADSLITEAILTGNLEAAVHLCLNSQRTAEALLSPQQLHRILNENSK
ncbi:putative RNA-directed DNA polymerase from transposon BS [Lucilia cuprina]|nr:putative RNA-directed DNA polymerase from transposon BS [Lucilia cuprina]